MGRTALILMLITVFSKILGFIRELTLSYTYGTSYISDAYLIALTIPSAIFGFVSNGVIAGYIPMYNRIASEAGESECAEFSSKLENALILLCTIVICSSLFFTESIVKLFASGFTGQTLDLAVNFTKITLLSIYFPSLIAVYTGYLQVKGSFIVPALVGIPFNFLVIASLLFSVKIGVQAMAVGFVFAMSVKWILLVVNAFKYGYHYRFNLDFKDPFIQEFFRLVLPIVIGLSANQINVLVDRTIASSIAEGGISALNYANRITIFAQGIFVLSISAVLYPRISKLAVQNKITEMKKSLSSAVTGISLLMLPSAAGMIIFSQPIVRLLFKRGAFDDISLGLTASALTFYSIGIIGWGIGEVALRVYYALQDTKTPTILAAAGILLNIMLNVVLSSYMGIGGLALATSIASMFTAFLLLMGLRKKIGALGITQMLISFKKILIATLIMSIVARGTYELLLLSYWDSNLVLLISIILAAIVYFVFVYLAKVEGLQELAGAIKKFFLRRVV